MGVNSAFRASIVVQAIAVDPGIENSDNVPKGFYGGGGTCETAVASADDLRR